MNGDERRVATAHPEGIRPLPSLNTRYTKYSWWLVDRAS